MQVKQVFSSNNIKEHDIPGRYKYCPLCGIRLTLQEHGGRQRPSYPECSFIQFQNPVPGVVVLIENNNSILIGKRKGGYGKGKWGLPQGFIEFDEDFLTAGIREVKEETGLDVEIQSILNVVSNLLTPDLHTLAIILSARVIAGIPSAGDDLEALKWIPVSGPLPEMAFKADEQIIHRYQNMKCSERLPTDRDYARAV